MWLISYRWRTRFVVTKENIKLGEWKDSISLINVHPAVFVAEHHVIDESEMPRGYYLPDQISRIYSAIEVPDNLLTAEQMRVYQGDEL